MAATNSGPAHAYSQDEVDRCLQAMVAWAGNSAAAVRWLQANSPEGQRVPNHVTLLEWTRTKYWERYEQIREQMGVLKEKTISNDMRDAVQEAIDAQRLAVTRAKERLEKDRDPEPAKSAAALARVAQANTDKLLSLTGRPSQITESRNAEEILRSLVAKGVLTLPDAPAEVTAESEDGG
jgi:hypothetical protein